MKMGFVAAVSCERAEVEGLTMETGNSDECIESSAFTLLPKGTLRGCVLRQTTSKARRIVRSVRSVIAVRRYQNTTITISPQIRKSRRR